MYPSSRRVLLVSLCMSRPQSLQPCCATLGLCVAESKPLRQFTIFGQADLTSTLRKRVFELVPQLLPRLVPPLVALLQPLQVEDDGAERHPQDDGDGHEGDQAGRAAEDDDGDALARGRVVEGVARGAGAPGAPRADAAAGVRVPHPAGLQAAFAGGVVGAAALARGRVVELREKSARFVIEAEIDCFPATLLWSNRIASGNAVRRAY